MERFLASAADAFGRIDGLAAIAGAYAGAGPLEEAPADEWAPMLDANLETAYAVCRAALPHLLKTGGSVVTVASRRSERAARAPRPTRSRRPAWSR